LNTARDETAFMPRFVILRHEMPPGSSRPSHFDLMFEAQGVLRTWCSPVLPTPGQDCAVEPLDDHRLDWLNREGDVSGGRGTVRRVDQGTFEWVEDAGGRMVVRVSGGVLSGELALVVAPRPDPRGEHHGASATD
jgi:hypothetical protein